jgi:hypothetical protein
MWKTIRVTDGGQDYGALFVPNLPFMRKRPELPFYGVDDKLPYLLMIILGLQQCVNP